MKGVFWGMIFNEDTRVKIPATIQFLRLGYNYQSLKDADVDFNTKIFINFMIKRKKNTLKHMVIRMVFLKMIQPKKIEKQ